MGNYWCSYCSIFITDTKISRSQHEQSVKHRNSISKTLKKSHVKNRQIEKEQSLAKKEISRINKELNLAGNSKKDTQLYVKSTQKNANDKVGSGEESKIHETNIGEWVTSEVNENQSEQVPVKEAAESYDKEIPTDHHPIKRAPKAIVSAGDEEVENYRVEERKIELDSESEDKPLSKFKKRKIPAKLKKKDV